MQDYIVCEKRGNLPRIHIKICQIRCKESNICEAYQDYLKNDLPDDVVAGTGTTDWSAEKGLSATPL
jgi:hypothetical protein